MERNRSQTQTETLEADFNLDGSGVKLLHYSCDIRLQQVCGANHQLFTKLFKLDQKAVLIALDSEQSAFPELIN